MNSAVFGLEADIDYSSIAGNLETSGTGPVFVDPYNLTLSQRLKWLSTARGRLGFTPTPQTLIYVTGGLAAGEVSTTSNLDFTVTHYDVSTSTTKAGWTVGGGIEIALAGNWSAKAEYLFYNLGSITSIANPMPPNPPFQTQTALKVTGNIARVGINYKLGAH